MFLDRCYPYIWPRRVLEGFNLLHPPAVNRLSGQRSADNCRRWEGISSLASFNVVFLLRLLLPLSFSANLFQWAHRLVMLSFTFWFRTKVGVRLGCLLSTTLFNIYLERIMTDALEDHEDTVSIGGGATTSLRFADDIDGFAGEEEELANFVERLDKASTALRRPSWWQTTPVASTQRSKWMDRSLRQSQASNTWAQL